jgi:subtilase family protein
MSRLRARALVVAGGVTVGLLGAAAPVAAEVGAPAATVQAIAADAQFLEYAPPPASPGVVCLIDSGVDPNPDTTPILAGSYAMEPGTDTNDELSKLNPPIQPGNHPDGHGTYMAMIMAAPVNGWGMVGIAPTSVRVFNVKALAAGQSTFAAANYANSIVDCDDGPAHAPGVKVINLSLGSGTPPTSADVGAVQAAVNHAGVDDVNVVGAAGNDGGAVSYPATASGVLAVGAADANPANLGVFCPNSGRGSVLAILAPGCGTQSEPGGGGGGLDVAFSDDGTAAWASGTSDASAIVSAVLASMRSYGTSLTADEASACLTSTTVNGGNLDAAAAFRACGLGAVVSEGLSAYQAVVRTSSQSVAAQPATSPAPPPSEIASAPAVGSEPAPWTVRPRVVGVVFRAGHLVVTVASVPRGAQLRVDAERDGAGGRVQVVATATTSRRVAKLTTSHWDRVAALFIRDGARSRVSYVTRQNGVAHVSSAPHVLAPPWVVK